MCTISEIIHNGNGPNNVYNQLNRAIMLTIFLNIPKILVKITTNKLQYSTGSNKIQHYQCSNECKYSDNHETECNNAVNLF